jgi:hypothetical protein
MKLISILGLIAGYQKSNLWLLYDALYLLHVMAFRLGSYCLPTDPMLTQWHASASAFRKRTHFSQKKYDKISERAQKVPLILTIPNLSLPPSDWCTTLQLFRSRDPEGYWPFSFLQVEQKRFVWSFVKIICALFHRVLNEVREFV